MASEKDNRTLWMGELDAYMDANFIGEAFHKMGEEIISVKIIYDKYSGQTARYCFVEMPSSDAARRCMLTINGKIVPDSRPPITFKLSFAQNPSNPSLEYALFVSNLASEVDDAALYNLFGRRYFTCKGAKVFRNQDDGSSKGVGLVRFGDQREQLRALSDLNRWPLAGRPIQIKLARHRGDGGSPKKQVASNYDPSTYYKTYREFYNSSQWQMYDFFKSQNVEHDHGDIGTTATLTNAAIEDCFCGDGGGGEFEGDETYWAQPEDPHQCPSVEEENARCMYQSQLLDRQLEASNWFFLNSASFHQNQL